MRTPSNIVRGSLLAVTAFFFMALFGILTKLSLQTSSFIWTSFVAYLTATLLLLPFIAYQGFSSLKSDHYQLLLGRAVFGTIASFSYTVAIHFIPIVNGTLLFNTAPIFIPLLSILFLHSKIAHNIWWAVFLGFLGIVVIIHPTEAIFTQTGNIVGLLSGICLAIAYFLMKILTNTESGIRIIFYYLAIGSAMQIPLLPFFTSPNRFGFFYAVCSGMALLLAQMTLVKAYKYAKASEVGVYQYASVIFVAIFDWIIWNQIPPPGDLFGIALVSIAGILIIRHPAST